MSYQKIRPHFQIKYRRADAYLLFVDEEPGCPGMFRERVIAVLDYTGMEEAARELLATQNSACMRLRNWWVWRGIRRHLTKNEKSWRKAWEE